MRIDNHIHIRHVVLYHYEKGWTAVKSFRDINEFDEGTISESQCRELFSRLKFGYTNLEDNSGRGRLSDFDDQALLAAVEQIDNSNAGQKIQRRSFHNCTSSPKTGECVEITRMGATRILRQKQTRPSSNIHEPFTFHIFI